MTYARERLTWDAKAQIVTQIMDWVLARGPKPDLRPPKALAAGVRCTREVAEPYAGSTVSG